MLGAYVLSLVLGMRVGMAGYLDVEMAPANECGHSLVQWSGDDGPYHLLLTPTAHAEHGYNVWLPSIPAGTNSYNLTIRQPAGLQFVLTMWGMSGITYAGTTDIMTVGPNASASPNSTATCFLTNEQILGLYTFSFNIFDSSNGLPAQCSNLTMSWPTSLESNVTGAASDNGTLVERDPLIDGLGEVWDPETESYEEFDSRSQSSSSESHGNTTYPPSMFGVIPLGNSFSIPITYPRTSRTAKYLPDSSRSDTPTTWTRDGVTNLNWTIQLAKGTRFILVAGIGSDQQWASGGSSSLMVVGQGATDCVGVNPDDGEVASVTATTGTYSMEPTGATGGGGSRGGSPLIRTILACVLSILGTLVIVGLLVFCCRARKARRARKVEAKGQEYPRGSLRKSLTRSGAGDYSTSDTPLDILGSREDVHLAPVLTSHDRIDSPQPLSPVDRSGTYQQPWPTISSSGSPISPVNPHSTFGRQSSLDPLLSLSPTRLSSPMNESFGGTVSTGPLMLHDRMAGLPYERDEDIDEDDMPELKRETLAHATQPGPSGPRNITRNAPRRRRDDAPTDYVVHRDAGRVRQGAQTPSRVVELPPRYEELNWERERREEVEEAERTDLESGTR